MNDPKRSIRYFKQNDLVRNIGALLAVAGLIWFFSVCRLPRIMAHV